jgi:hypothetical protein
VGKEEGIDVKDEGIYVIVAVGNFDNLVVNVEVTIRSIHGIN